MKYKVKQTDIFLKGQVIPEGTIIDSKKYSEEDIESVMHLLEEAEKITVAQPNANTETKPDSANTTSTTIEETKTKRTKKPKQ